MGARLLGSAQSLRGHMSRDRLAFCQSTLVQPEFCLEIRTRVFWMPDPVPINLPG